ncbi:LysR family transcriptional regulator [Cohnella zeiphila]|uniref:LysR family transcriptional regulator n=1 Tax=Cohnella zeiphila TaxID=2761120 RepID=A0A7X0SSN0_9BACL|nr:LysR family transcriptional regulator [Cohnella zeiphila]MBB6735403.1 LysR family transcriptional regulator [Cohnella zeiphila]
MDMEGLHSFIAVARERSISKAAQSLHVTQPTLSARLRKLEDSLGVALVERGWEGVRLTKQGRFFLTYSVQLFQELEEAAALLRKRAARELDQPIEAATKDTRLRIGVESFLYPAFMNPVIQAIQRVDPEAECNFVSKSSNLLMNMLESDGLDLCVSYIYHPKPNLQSVKVLDDEAVLMYPFQDYPDIQDDLGNVGLLFDKPFVLFENSPLLLYRDVTEKVFLYLFGRIPERFHIVDNVSVTIDIVSSGFGYTFMPGSSIAHLAGRPLPFRRVTIPAPFRVSPVYISYSEALSARHPIAALIESIRSRLSDRIEGRFS